MNSRFPIVFAGLSFSACSGTMAEAETETDAEEEPEPETAPDEELIVGPWHIDRIGVNNAGVPSSNEYPQDVLDDDGIYVVTHDRWFEFFPDLSGVMVQGEDYGNGFYTYDTGLTWAHTEGRSFLIALNGSDFPQNLCTVAPDPDSAECSATSTSGTRTLSLSLTRMTESPPGW